MLRNALVAIGVVAMLAGIPIALAGSGPQSLSLFAIGAILTIGVMVERWRYKKIEPKPQAGWQPTGERFIDPETGRVTQVYYDAATGRRHYVEAQKE